MSACTSDQFSCWPAWRPTSCLSLRRWSGGFPFLWAGTPTACCPGNGMEGGGKIRAKLRNLRTLLNGVNFDDLKKFQSNKSCNRGYSPRVLQRTFAKLLHTLHGLYSGCGHMYSRVLQSGLHRNKKKRGKTSPASLVSAKLVRFLPVWMVERGAQNFLEE